MQFVGACSWERLKSWIEYRIKTTSQGQHFRFQLEDKQRRRLFGVAWKMADRIPPTGVALDMAVELAWNHFNDRKLLQLELVDWRPGE